MTNRWASQGDGRPRVAVRIADPRPGTRSAIRDALKDAKAVKVRWRGSGPAVGDQRRFR
jgi:hypothetical protein